MTDTIANIFDRIAVEAQKEDAEAEVVISNSESFSTNFMKGALNKYSFDHSVSIGVRVLYGKGAGFSTTERLSIESVVETFQESLQSAKDLDREAKGDQTAQKLFRPTVPPFMMNLINSEIDSFPISEKLRIAETLERSALEFDPRVENVPYSGYSESKTKRFLFNTAGVDLSMEGAGVSVYSYALSKSGPDLKTGLSSRFSRLLRTLDPEQIGREAAQKAVGLLGASQPRSGNYPVVLAAEVARQLISFLDHHLSAKTIDEGKSLLKGRIGERIFSDKITIVDDPFRVELSGARPFDSEGAPSQKTITIEQGLLKSYLSNSHLSEKMGIPHTANAVRSGGEMSVSSSNMVVSPGTSELDQLFSSAPQIIFVTAVDALHSGFNQTTLDFSLPAYGFWYENGERVKPLHQMVLSGNLGKILKDVAMVSNRYSQDGSSVLCPDLLIPEISIAGA